MKKSILFVLLPVFMGTMIAAIVLVLPAKASLQINTPDHDHEGMHVYGTIDSFPEGLVGDWIVNGITYTADSETTFRQEHGSFAVGACVGIEYMQSFHQDGYRALSIQTEYDYKCQTPPNPVSETTGIVITYPVNLVGTWVVDTSTFTATDHTRFEQEEGPFTVGGCVDVKYISQTGEALEISTAEAEQCGGESEQKFYGIIQQTPPTDTITGTWVISGVEFLSTYETHLDTEHGPLTVGACAKVEYRVVNGLNMADEISSQWAYRCSGFHDLNQVFGAVTSFPPDLYGTWIISPTNDSAFTFVTDPSTHFLGRYWDIGIGTCVRVKYYTQDGINHAVQLSVNWGHHCRPVQMPDRSKLIGTVGSRPTDTLTGTWIYAGVPFTATIATRFDEGAQDLQVGDCAENLYDPVGGAMLLKHVEGEDAYKCQAQDGSQVFRLFGFIETMPDGGVLTGTWQVSGVSMEAISTTLFRQDHGAFAPGAFVGVTFTYDEGTGVRTATKIETRIAPGYGHHNWFGHVEKIQHATGPGDYDRWTVDGVTYLADPAMETSSGLGVGSLVAVNAYTDNGNLFATRIVAPSSVYLPVINR